jgi:hypothetical protein
MIIEIDNIQKSRHESRIVLTNTSKASLARKILFLPTSWKKKTTVVVGTRKGRQTTGLNSKFESKKNDCNRFLFFRNGTATMIFLSADRSRRATLFLQDDHFLPSFLPFYLLTFLLSFLLTYFPSLLTLLPSGISPLLHQTC